MSQSMSQPQAAREFYLKCVVGEIHERQEQPDHLFHSLVQYYVIYATSGQPVLTLEANAL